MLTYQILDNIRKCSRGAIHSRNIGILAPCLQKASDPIQQLFLDKIKEYRQKSGGGNKLFEPSPDVERELKSELEKVAKVYGGGPGVDMTKFPTIKFTEPVIDPINLEAKK
ncbi:ATP-synt F6 domain containing protein [Asbolus verrucosus]|uniref:ATP synthase-coupling factor 6, mitochondrial n=1 Tax=Asbolus verrucosus TaxID=1661398 RepID=A0A482VIM0_ASBVE|nr:ATP-synt F6 domain containing protein [Asbolus verrucosus]